VPLADLLAALKVDAEEWCRGRLWLPRAPLVLLSAWWLLGHLRDYEYAPIIAGLNLGIHELGHFLFSPLGRFMGVAGGSLAQCLAPLIGIVMFFRQRDWFAVSFALVWLGTNLFYVGTYILDANGELNLPLVSPFRGEVVHDGYYLCERMGLLAHNARIAGLLRISATVSCVAGIAGGVWLCVVMARSDGGGPRA
jgi:hypothetical protein